MIMDRQPRRRGVQCVSCDQNSNMLSHQKWSGNPAPVNPPLHPVWQQQDAPTAPPYIHTHTHTPAAFRALTIEPNHLQHTPCPFPPTLRHFARNPSSRAAATWAKDIDTLCRSMSFGKQAARLTLCLRFVGVWCDESCRGFASIPTQHSWLWEAERSGAAHRCFSRRSCAPLQCTK